jgi:hypothetical protein
VLSAGVGRMFHTLSLPTHIHTNTTTLHPVLLPISLCPGLNAAPGLFFAPNGDLYVVESSARVRVISDATSTIDLLFSAAPPAVTLPLAPGVPATSYTFMGPRGVVTDGRNGDMYIADAAGNSVFIFRNSALGTTVFAFAGTGEPCVVFTGPLPVCGDGGAASSALLNFPYGVALNARGDVAIADYGSNRVRLVSTATGIISTVLGTGESSYGPSGVPGDGVPGTTSVIAIPQGIAFDPASGDLFVADPVAFVIRRVYLSGPLAGYVFNVVGIPGTKGFSMDPTPPLMARIGSVYFMAFREWDGALLFSDGVYSTVYALPAGAGNLSRVVGVPWAGSRPACSPPPTEAAWRPEFGDGGPATLATLSYGSGLAIDAASGNLFVVSANDNSVRMVDNATGLIWTVAGKEYRRVISTVGHNRHPPSWCVMCATAQGLVSSRLPETPALSGPLHWVHHAASRLMPCE